ncbi:MAG: hypothetical protein A3K19_08010 [Lentisphaerae bacterium RIFOXYB12_FULL_65_16]|nr:MAG: hypothetical protein A3K18_08820 [Lentisphaerae bacterium RIFOXYA12_64_32]OGV87592.1 MAG: hypothetical protein A3K19_08010 [Lentisphaerae bacterium RIFOXYB12_FULL_65_16]
MKTVLTIAMLVSGAVMLWSLHRHKTGYHPLAKPLAFVCAVIALLCALANMLVPRGPNPVDIMKNEMAYQRISAEALGAYLADKCPGARALIIVPPDELGWRVIDSGAGGQPRPLVEGLKAGFGDRITVVAEVAPELPEAWRKSVAAVSGPSAEQGPMAMPDGPMLMPEFYLTAEAFDALVERYRGRCDLVVSTIGLPQDLRGMKFWQSAIKPKLALAAGQAYELREAIRRNLIAGMVIQKPGFVPDYKRPPQDKTEAFAKRFLLLTTDNVDRIASEFAEVFIDGGGK